MAIDKNVVVKIPPEAKVYHDRVVVIGQGIHYSKTQQRNVREKNTIGMPHPVEPGMMYPNDTYKLLYRDEYETQAHTKLPVGELMIGMYASIKMIAEEIGLYEILTTVFGEKRAHMMLDYAAYTIVCHSNTSQHFEYRMSNMLLFSRTAYSDSVWSDYFSHITREEIQLFKDLWIEKCHERGLTSGFISADGSNDDCESEGIDEAAKGKSKSGKNRKIVGFMYAVSNQDGTPLTWEAYRGSYVDSTVFENMLQYLTLHHITPKALLLDRGFCNKKCLDLIKSNHMNFIVKLVESTSGCKNMLSQFLDSLKFNVRKRIPGEQLFGESSSRQIQLFKDKETKGYVHLYYDWKNGGERAFALMDEVDAAKESLEQQIQKYNEEKDSMTAQKHESEACTKKRSPASPSGTEEHPKASAESQPCEDTGKSTVASSEDEKKQKERSLSIPTKLNKILKVLTLQDGHKSLAIDYDEYQKRVFEKGFFSIATSFQCVAAEAYAGYKLRDCPEKTFSTMKTQLGFHRFRTKLSKGLYGRGQVAFVAGILRNELRKAGREAAKTRGIKSMNANQVIDELLMMKAIRINGRYTLMNGKTSKDSAILKALSPSKAETTLQRAIDAANQVKRVHPSSSGRRHKKSKGKPTEATQPKRPVGRPRKILAESETPKIARKRGRPARILSDVEQKLKELPKRRVGRPTKAEQAERQKEVAEIMNGQIG